MRAPLPALPPEALAEMAADVRFLGTDWDLVVGHSLGGAVAAAEQPAADVGHAEHAGLLWCTRLRLLLSWGMPAGAIKTRSPSDCDGAGACSFASSVTSTRKD